MISDIIPEWCDVNTRKKKGVIALLKIWTGDMMNCARIQMKTWILMKNEHKATVQGRWDNRGKMSKAFQTWKKMVKHEPDEQTGGKEDESGRLERERTYGIKHWGKVRAIPRMHIQVKNFLQMGIG
eukprot:6195026-Pleurochrysis_carterae.AAC.1